jgi:1-acyl-sn-glycerol-3-phosphate acyltransferase
MAGHQALTATAQPLPGSVPLPDFTPPHNHQFDGSRWASRLLRLFGWRVQFAGVPTGQGVLIVYPHTSNWDFPVMMLAKWSVGIPARFWGKDKLFRIPVFGRWLTWVGGVPVQRTAAQGVVRQVVDLIEAKKQAGELFWLGLAPEGTRKRLPGWRSGFYQTALGADVPVGLIRLDYRLKEVNVLNFIRLSGDVPVDMARIAAFYEGVLGLVPGRAAPVVLLDAQFAREHAVVKGRP